MTATRTRRACPAGDATLPDELVLTPANGQAATAPPMVDQALVVLPVEALRAGGHNPRSDLGDLVGLAASIRAMGILEPLVVVPDDFGRALVDPEATFTVLAGHRRLAAAKLAGLTEVPCLVRLVASNEAQRMELALVENLQREGLAPLDEAVGYRALVKLGLAQKSIAERVGCSQSHVSKRLALLELPRDLQARITKGTLPLESAATLLKLKDHPDKLKRAGAEETPERVARAVEEAELDIAFEAKRAELIAVAKDKGWPVVDEPKNSWDKRPFKLLASWQHLSPELALDVHKHQAEPCHAVMIPKRRSWYAISATSVCTKPARHGPKGDSALKCKVPKEGARALTEHEAKQREDDKQRLATGKARVAVLAEAVAAYTPPHRSWPALERTLRATVSMAGSQECQIACHILGLDKTTIDTLKAQAESGAVDLHRAALAAALASVEARLRWNWSTWSWPEVPGYFAYLAELGYQPSPWEQAKLDEAAEAARAGD